MGRRRKRLIIQADLTSEEDREFVCWIKTMQKRRRLSEEIREGLRWRYQQASEPGGQIQVPVAALSRSAPDEVCQPRGELPDKATVAKKLKALVGGF